MACFQKFYLTVCISCLYEWFYVSICVGEWEVNEEKGLVLISGLKWHITGTKYCSKKHDWKMWTWYEKASSKDVFKWVIFEKIEDGGLD